MNKIFKGIVALILFAVVSANLSAQVSKFEIMEKLLIEGWTIEDAEVEAEIRMARLTQLYAEEYLRKVSEREALKDRLRESLPDEGYNKKEIDKIVDFHIELDIPLDVVKERVGKSGNL